MASLAGVAKKGPEWAAERSRKANAAKAAKNSAKAEAREDARQIVEKKLKKRGLAPDEVHERLKLAGLLPPVKRVSNEKSLPLPSEDDLRDYLDIVDREHPGLPWARRKRAAVALLRADLARGVWEASR
ncbi:hypothetical protein ASF83_00110 [Plantibacter sp. Leaf171]|uniref:hypothetical protein n=1 Tax=unclassified Plantibacter TaxID=2624265 RepID=UPI0006F444B8|nr:MULTISPECIES: hypothetical protein [unclassified Plantibacter]KQM17578.1 hypothetical protein ASE44_00110 [Plantibacter sp. Leaf1]KQR60361.1 hypothetical protein ASF83_00110 [Plantibacter sp. Leaf171]